MNLCFCTAPATTGSYCSEHLARLRRDLRRAPDVILDLDITIVGLAQQGGGGNGTETPLAFNERASDARQDLLYLLASAATIGHPAPRGTTLTPPQMAARALHGVDTIARSPAAHTIAADLTDALDEATYAIDWKPERKVVGRCQCGNLLTTLKDEGTVWCKSCEREHDISEWAGERYSKARDHTATIPVIAAYFTRDLGVMVSERTLRRWAEKGAFNPVDNSEPARYRIGDVMDAWERIKKKDLPGKKKVEDFSGDTLTAA